MAIRDWARRHPGWIIIGSLIVVFLIVGTVIQNSLEEERNTGRARYAGTYVGPSGEHLELHRDGVWVLRSQGGGEIIRRGEPDGSIREESWEVVGAHEACYACEFPPDLQGFTGDQAIFLPTDVARVRQRTMRGDYYGIEPGPTLVDAAGTRWSRASGSVPSSSG